MARRLASGNLASKLGHKEHKSLAEDDQTRESCNETTGCEVQDLPTAKANLGQERVEIHDEAYFPQFWVYFTLRLFSGLGTAGFYIPSFTLAVEFSGDHGALFSSVISIATALGSITLGGMAYALRDWQSIHRYTSILCLVSTLVWFVVSESPRWLISKGEVKKARKILLKGAKMNKNQLADDVFQMEISREDQKESKDIPQYGIGSVLANFTILKHSAIMGLNWIVTSMCFFGLSFNSVNLGGDMYLNFILTSLIEIPSYLFCILVLDHLGRKPVTIFCQCLAGITCCLAAFIKTDWIVTVLTLLGKFGASSSFTIIYLYMAELYPTSMRNSALGGASMMARLGSICAPILANISPPAIPMVIMGLSSLLGGVIVVFLPETLGNTLPDSLEEVEQLFRQSKPWYKWVSTSELAAMKARP
eukprot:maker-scaffold152_size304267-snap-gene-1.15 protein:Tk10110 transcript:maker-scaffold152_size304267-snap-gene-1.15-mRNA-1 annotation:"organic cation transporter protein"